MKYTYCTIAVGDYYFNNTIEFVKNLNMVSSTHNVLVFAEDGRSNMSIDNLTIKTIKSDETLFIKKLFNYHLKYLPIESSTELDTDFVIFFDADWRIHDEYDEKKLLNFLNIVNDSAYDFIFERPHTIGANKNNSKTCFWKHKIEPYNLLDISEYDDAHVVNEQFMVFKNNSKLKTFVSKWKERNEYGIKKQIWPFASGVEIGMSAIDAEMKMDWKLMFTLKKCFRFKSKEGKDYERF